MSRFPSDDSLSAIELNKSGSSEALAPIQRDKFSHFFTYLLDHDRDGYVNRKDFALLSEVESAFKNLYFFYSTNIFENNEEIQLWKLWLAQRVACLFPVPKT